MATSQSAIHIINEYLRINEKATLANLGQYLKDRNVTFEGKLRMFLIGNGFHIVKNGGMDEVYRQNHQPPPDLQETLRNHLKIQNGKATLATLNKYLIKHNVPIPAEGLTSFLNKHNYAVVHEKNSVHVLADYHPDYLPGIITEYLKAVDECSVSVLGDYMKKRGIAIPPELTKYLEREGFLITQTNRGNIVHLRDTTANSTHVKGSPSTASSAAQNPPNAPKPRTGSFASPHMEPFGTRSETSALNGAASPRSRTRWIHDDAFIHGNGDMRSAPPPQQAAPVHAPFDRSVLYPLTTSEIAALQDGTYFLFNNRARNHFQRSTSSHAFLGLCSSRDKQSVSEIFCNLAKPFIAVIIGMHGTGKTHTLRTILESAMIRTPLLGNLNTLYTTVVLHYDNIANGSSFPLLPCHSASVGDISPSLSRQFSITRSPVTVYVSPAMYTTMVDVYKHVNCEVIPLFFSTKDLDLTRVIDLLSPSDDDGWFEASTRSLSTESIFDWLKLQTQQSIHSPRRQELIRMWMSILNDLLYSRVFQMAERDQKNNFNTILSKWVPMQEKFRTDGVIIFDLRDPFICKQSARSIFDLVLQLFCENTHQLSEKKLIIMDDYNKYAQQSKDGLEKTLSRLTRDCHPLNLRIVLASNDPTQLSPELLENCTALFLHRFVSPRWYSYISGLFFIPKLVTPSEVTTLHPGQCIIVSPTFFLGETSSTELSTIRIQIRRKFAIDGDTTRFAPNSGPAYADTAQMGSINSYVNHEYHRKNSPPSSVGAQDLDPQSPSIHMSYVTDTALRGDSHDSYSNQSGTMTPRLDDNSSRSTVNVKLTDLLARRSTPDLFQKSPEFTSSTTTKQLEGTLIEESVANDIAAVDGQGTTACSSSVTAKLSIVDNQFRDSANNDNVSHSDGAGYISASE